MYKYVFLLFLVSLLIGCDNLDRKNPKDVHHGNYLFFAADTSGAEEGGGNIGSSNTYINGPNVQIHEVKISSETINDNVVSPGESLILDVELENNGNQDARGVTVRYLCTSLFVSNLRPTGLASFATNGASGPNLIYSGSKARCIMPSQELSFQVVSYATPGLPIEIDLIIEDEQGNIWTQTIETRVNGNVASSNNSTGNTTISNSSTSTSTNTSSNTNTSNSNGNTSNTNSSGTTNATPRVEFDRYELYSDANYDQVISRGERVQIATYIINTGNVKVFSPQVTITADPIYFDYIEAHNDVNYYSMENSLGFNIPVGWDAKPMFSYQFLTFKTKANLPANTIIPFQMVIKTASNRTYSETFFIKIEE